MSKMIEIDGVEISVDTVKSALEKAGVKLKKKVDWRKLKRGTVVESNTDIGLRAVVITNNKANCNELLRIDNYGCSQNYLVNFSLNEFNDCKVIGRIKFVVEEI